MDHAEYAEELFYEGYNCAQAVAAAFCDVMDLDRETAAKLASSFGGGMGRMREVCGTVSGALLVLGMVKGYADPGDPEAKSAHYARVQEFGRRFREEKGSIICRELLAGVPVSTGGTPEERTPDFYRKRPCAGLVYSAAQLLSEMLENDLP